VRPARDDDGFTDSINQFRASTGQQTNGTGGSGSTVTAEVKATIELSPGLHSFTPQPVKAQRRGEGHRRRQPVGGAIDTGTPATSRNSGGESGPQLPVNTPVTHYANFQIR